MKLLRYDAPPRHVLVEEGRQIHGGEEFEVTNERAEELLTNPHLAVSEVGAGSPEPPDEKSEVGEGVEPEFGEPEDEGEPEIG
jgi:hypothetical protein